MFSPLTLFFLLVGVFMSHVPQELYDRLLANNNPFIHRLSPIPNHSTLVAINPSPYPHATIFYYGWNDQVSASAIVSAALSLYVPQPTTCPLIGTIFTQQPTTQLPIGTVVHPSTPIWQAQAQPLLPSQPLPTMPLQPQPSSSIAFGTTLDQGASSPTLFGSWQGEDMPSLDQLLGLPSQPTHYQPPSHREDTPSLDQLLGLPPQPTHYQPPSHGEDTPSLDQLLGLPSQPTHYQPPSHGEDTPSLVQLLGTTPPTSPSYPNYAPQEPYHGKFDIPNQLAHGYFSLTISND